MAAQDQANDAMDEARMIIDLVAKFVDQELMPLEPAILAREAKGEALKLSPEEEAPLLEKCRELGLWALDAPEELGGANLNAETWMGINEELGRTVVPVVFPPDSPNMHMLLAVATEEQRKAPRGRHGIHHRQGNHRARNPARDPHDGRTSHLRTRA